MKKLVQVSTDAKRGTIETDAILQNVNINTDIITSPSNLISQFVDEKDLEKYNQIVDGLNLKIDFQTLDMNSFKSQVNSLLDLLDKNQISYDVRLQDRNRLFKSGGSLFFEQFNLSLSGELTDSEFNQVYTDLKKSLENNPVAFISFISKSDDNKTIQYTTSTRIIKELDKNEPLLFSYEARAKTEPYMSIEKNTSNKNKANYNWENLIKSLYNSIDTIDSNLIVQIGKSSTVSLKSHFFDNKDLSEDDLQEEKEIKIALEDARNIKILNNNIERGSMSPNSTKEYIENKNINEDVLELDREVKSKLDSLIEKRDSLKDSLEILKESKTANYNELNNLGGEIFNLNQKIKELESKEGVKATLEPHKGDENENKDIDTDLVEDDPKNILKDEETINTKIKENIVPKTSSSINLQNLSSFENELSQIFDREMEAVRVANLKKHEQAPKIADEMLKSFKEAFEQGGSVLSNVEKISQQYRDNIYAIELFNLKLKSELKSTIIKDKIIGNLHGNIDTIVSEFEVVKQKYEKTIADITDANKKLLDEKLSVENKFFEMEKEFEEYETTAINSLTKNREKIVELEEALKDYEQMKENDSNKDALILELSNVNDSLVAENRLIKKDIEVLTSKLSNTEALKDVNLSQKSIIEQLQKDNIKLRADFDLANSSLTDLQEQLKKIQNMNIDLQKHITTMDKKIEVGKELKKELSEQSKSVKIIEKKEQILEATNKNISYLKGITSEELDKKILDVFDSLENPNLSPEYHRISLVKTGNINLSTVQKLSNLELKKVIENVAQELLDNNLAYYDEKSNKVLLKENAKVSIFNNPKGTIEEIKSSFEELQAVGRQENASEKFTPSNNSNSYKKLR